LKKENNTVNDKFTPYLRVGILHNSYYDGILRSEVPGRFGDVFIDKKNLNGAPFGMRVVCKVIEEPDNYGKKYPSFLKDEMDGFGMPKGVVVEVLGEPDSNDSTMAGIMISHNLSSKFPEKVLDESTKFPQEISDEEIAKEIEGGRKDIRDEVIVTIDGEDTKDIDDGLSITVENGITILGVHIADVAHYVKENSHLDKEALERGCSVYMADRVIPMLPPVLSNNLCSLNPRKPRFALTARIGFNSNGDQVSFSVMETVIQSNDRLTYTQVYNMLSEDKSKDDEFIKYKDMLLEIKNLSEKLRNKRFENGSIDFDFTETKLKLDANKNVLEIYPVKSTFANYMIEECMIACNQAISKYFTQKKAPFIYRVHQKPDPDKLYNFTRVAKLLGEKIKLKEEPESKDIQKIIHSLDGKPYKETLMQLILRSMSKAVYSDKCEGHYGLGITYYSHFTSPIRRYPDLFIHRVIKSYIKGNQPSKTWKKKALNAAEISTDAEINSMFAERESVDYKTAQYMKQFVGETFEGKVTGLQDFGIFVRLENSVEGMAPFRTLKNYYEYHEEQILVKAKETGNTIRIGDSVRVKVADSDTIARRIEFLLHEKEATPKSKKEKYKNGSFEKRVVNKKNKGNKKAKKKRK